MDNLFFLIPKCTTGFKYHFVYSLVDFDVYFYRNRIPNYQIMLTFVSNNDTKNHKIMIAEIQKFIEIQNNIDQILKNSPVKLSFIIEKSGIKKPTFFKKLKEKRFTPQELLIIAEYVEPRTWRNETKEEILESLKRSEEDFKNGRTHDYKEVMEASRLRLEKYRNESKIL